LHEPVRGSAGAVYRARRGVSMSEDVTVRLPAQRTDAHMTESAVRAFFRSWTAMLRACPKGSEVTVDGLLRGRTGLPVAPFNGVWAPTPTPSASAVLAAVDDFARGDLPWNLQLRPGYPAELDAALAGRGLVVTAQIPFMTLTDVGPLVEVVRDAEVGLRPLETFADLDAALSLLERGFGMPPELVRQQFAMQMLFQPSFTTWLLRAGGEDVSTALGVMDDDWAGVFNVATPEEHRGKGYGAVATAQSVLGAGGRSAYLQASPMGFPVYERLGFATVEHWTQWMPAEYAGG
jgi:hypothetical protein